MKRASLRGSTSHRAVLQAIDRGVTFLHERQLPHGEFVTLLGADERLSNAVPDSTPFTTAFVLYGLCEVDGGLARDVAVKAASFLRSEMEFGAVWRYWSTRDHKHHRLPPDLDDASCISYALKTSGDPRLNNDWAFWANRDAAGRFRTWILPTKRNWTSPWFWVARSIGFGQARLRARKLPPPECEDARFRVMQIERDDVDPVVNANAVLYLGEGPRTLAAIDFVIRAVFDERPGWSAFYRDRLVLYYAAARAYRHAAPSLRAVRAHVVSRIEKRAAEREGLRPLQAALAASALLTFDPASAVTADLIGTLVETQRRDGGWDAHALYGVWGSAELTTGLCLEALGRYARPAQAAC